MATMTITAEDRSMSDSLPTLANGAQYPFSMLDVKTGDVVFAESRTELVAHIIDDYETSFDTEAAQDRALWQRYQIAVRVAGGLQAFLAAAAQEEGTFVPELITENDLNALLGDKSEKPDDIKSWDHTVPLVLISTDYAPHTQIAAPSGNVLWINPYNETTFLESLETAGLINVFVTED